MDFFGVNIISQINVFLISEQLTKAFRLEAFISERPSNSVTPPPTSRVTPPSSASAARPKASVQQSILLAVRLLFSLDLVRFLILNIFKDPNQLRSDLLLQGEETDALPPRFAASEESSGDKEEKEGKAGKDSSKKEKTEKTEKKAKEVKNKDKKKTKRSKKTDDGDEEEDENIEDPNHVPITGEEDEDDGDDEDEQAVGGGSKSEAQKEDKTRKKPAKAATKTKPAKKPAAKQRETLACLLSWKYLDLFCCIKGIFP